MILDKLLNLGSVVLGGLIVWATGRSADKRKAGGEREAVLRSAHAEWLMAVFVATHHLRAYAERLRIESSRRASRPELATGAYNTIPVVRECIHSFRKTDLLEECPLRREEQRLVTRIVELAYQSLVFLATNVADWPDLSPIARRLLEGTETLAANGLSQADREEVAAAPTDVREVAEAVESCDKPFFAVITETADDIDRARGQILERLGDIP